jgi:hypothetical protein
MASDVLQPFCADDGWLNQPFVKNGKRYATDGKIAVCIASDDIDTPEEKGKRRMPDMERVINTKTPCIFDWQYPVRECQECNGTGKSESDECPGCDGDGECTECNGSGQTECCSCGQDTECEECGGTGKCEECNGLGKVDPETTPCHECSQATIDVSDNRLAFSLARKINALQGVKYTVLNNQQMVFESSCGVRGVAMFLGRY